MLTLRRAASVRFLISIIVASCGVLLADASTERAREILSGTHEASSRIPHVTLQYATNANGNGAVIRLRIRNEPYPGAYVRADVTRNVLVRNRPSAVTETTIWTPRSTVRILGKSAVRIDAESGRPKWPEVPGAHLSIATAKVLGLSDHKTSYEIVEGVKIVGRTCILIRQSLSDASIAEIRKSAPDAEPKDKTGKVRLLPVKRECYVDLNTGLLIRQRVFFQNGASASYPQYTEVSFDEIHNDDIFRVSDGILIREAHDMNTFYAGLNALKSGRKR